MKCISKLIDDHKEESSECLCNVLNKVGKDFDNVNL